MDKVEDYKKNEYIHEGMQWSFDEKHWDKKFEKKIKQLFLDLVHRVLSLLVVHSVNDGTDVFSTYDAENMTLDDMHALFVTQDWLSKLTN